MATPSEKSLGMEIFLGSLTEELYGRSRTESITSGICVTCGGDATAFRDALSQKEFTISGMCQGCQDKTFR